MSSQHEIFAGKLYHCRDTPPTPPFHPSPTALKYTSNWLVRGVYFRAKVQKVQKLSVWGIGLSIFQPVCLVNGHTQVVFCNRWPGVGEPTNAKETTLIHSCSLRQTIHPIILVLTNFDRARRIRIHLHKSFGNIYSWIIKDLFTPRAMIVDSLGLREDSPTNHRAGFIWRESRGSETAVGLMTDGRVAWSRDRFGSLSLLLSFLRIPHTLSSTVC